MAIDIEADMSISTNIDRKGIPRAQMLIIAIREIGEKQPDNEEFYETSDEAIHLKELLKDALDEIDQQRGQTRFK